MGPLRSRVVHLDSREGSAYSLPWSGFSPAPYVPFKQQVSHAHGHYQWDRLAKKVKSFLVTLFLFKHALLHRIDHTSQDRALLPFLLLLLLLLFQWAFSLRHSPRV